MVMTIRKSTTGDLEAAHKRSSTLFSMRLMLRPRNIDPCLTWGSSIVTQPSRIGMDDQLELSMSEQRKAKI